MPLSRAFTYLEGVAYYGSGQTARAYHALEQISPDPDARWYARYVSRRSGDLRAPSTPFFRRLLSDQRTPILAERRAAFQANDSCGAPRQGPSVADDAR